MFEVVKKKEGGSITRYGISNYGTWHNLSILSLSTISKKLSVVTKIKIEFPET